MIIAAGLGRRLNPYTNEMPKCMLDFGGKTLLQRQLDVFRACGIEEVSVIRGYKKEKINYDGLRYYENLDYENNNILNSLFYGEAELNGPIVISYSDILFEMTVVEQLLKSDEDISIVVDIDWQDYYVDRIDHPIEEAENVVFGENSKVREIGKIFKKNDHVDGEFIGMLKLSQQGTKIFKEHFHRAKEMYWDLPFQHAQTFQKAYLTDFIQEMVELGVIVHCVKISKCWKEIDTVEDYQKALASRDM
jgi:phosphoenolpyruvate phosphomutase